MRVAAVFLGLILASVHVELAAQIEDARADALRRAMEEIAPVTEMPSGALSLPGAALTEPFEIGGALYEGRAAEAIVSLLAQMDIRIAGDGDDGAGGRLRLRPAEVRALIALAKDDLDSSTELDDLPYSFADVHRAVAPLLPGVSVQDLARRYARAYEAAPDTLVLASCWASRSSRKRR